MTSLRYHRNYFWIFFYLYFVLMIVALVLDSASPITSSKLKLARFMNVLFPFLFAIFGMVLQHNASVRLLDLDLLQADRKKWAKRYIRIKNKRKWKDIEKVAKKREFMIFIFCNSLANVIALLPLFIVGILLFFFQSQNETHKIFNKEFFLISFLIRNVSWYLTLFTSKILIFWKKKRVKNLI